MTTVLKYASFLFAVGFVFVGGVYLLQALHLLTDVSVFTFAIIGFSAGAILVKVALSSPMQTFHYYKHGYDLIMITLGGALQRSLRRPSVPKTTTHCRTCPKFSRRMAVWMSLVITWC